jgi:non-homologous end joining protein Ku
MKRMNAGWLTDIEQKSFDLQISVIKSAKINRYFKEMQDNYQIQMQSLLNQQIKKREKALADAKTLRGSIETIRTSEKNYCHRTQF